MPESPVSRRNFLAAAAAGAAHTPVVQPPVLLSTAKAQAAPFKVVTTYRFTPDELAVLKAAAPAADIVIVPRNELAAKLRDAEVFFGEPGREILEAAPNLKWVQWGGAGMEGMDPALRQSPVVVTNCARTFAPAITETGMGLLLNLTRGISTLYMPQFEKRQMRPVGTVKSADHTELAGRTMAIVGMGGIGSTLARRAHYGFDMRVIATDAKPLPKPEYVAELHDPTWFSQMVPQADVLVAAAPHTPQTERMFNEKVFRRMKKGSYFLALSRGMLYDDLALVKALKEGWIAGAGLDVFPIEPPPSSHPIFDCKNVVMTAHTSGWSPDRQDRLIALWTDNLRRYSEGLPLVNVVDKQRGY